ncbi:MAG: PMT 2 protein, partial [Anaerolineales bacterium]|nr:PMT 2 protein [Anaerolineales bacterium]
MAAGNAGFNYALHPDHLWGNDYRIAVAVLVVRVLGVVFSTASVIFVYRGMRLIWPAHAKMAWAATCLYAFWPQFLFTGSMFTNDVLVTALAAVFFYLALKLVISGFHAGWALGMGLTLGGAMLTKITAAGLIPMAG